MQGRLIIICATCLGLLGLPAQASASTATVVSGETTTLFYEATAGETNHAVLSQSGSTVTIVDSGAVIQANAGCVAVSDHEVDCTTGLSSSVEIELKGGADYSRVVGSQIHAAFAGGKGPDQLIGGGSVDRFDGGPGPDVIKGRGSIDTVSYLNRSQPVKVTLGDGKRNDGGGIDGAKRDKLKSIENIFGGNGSDVLVGTNGENTIVAQGGGDTIRGRGGDDDIYPGDGRDVAFGGPGDDLFAPSNGRDRHYGNGGKDHFQTGSFGGNGPDLYSGGGGKDEAQFGSGPERIKLDGKANDGPCANPACSFSNEGDNILGIEIIDAGWGDDVIIGSKRGERIVPSRGADIVRAKAGNDVIEVSVDGDLDVYNCGPGADQIIGTADAFDQNKFCE